MNTDDKLLSRRRLLEMMGASGLTLAASTALAGRGDDNARGREDERGPRTKLTRDYDRRYPFVGAGMGFVALPELVAAVSNVGGLGVLGNGIEPPPSTQLLIQRIRQLTAAPFGVDYGVVDTPSGPGTNEGHIDVAVAERVPLVVFHFDLPPQQWVTRLQAAGTRVWAQVPSREQALGAFALGVDGVIAQGTEAGGHTRSTTPLHKLLRQIRRDTDGLVLAAGGITTGEDVIRALGHGADGVWVGTRLIASVEAYAHPEYKRRIVEARKHATVLTTMFGPELPGEPYRVLRNRVVNQWAGKEGEIPSPPPPPAVIGETILFPQTFRVPYPMPKFSAIVPTPDTTGDFEEMGLPAGAGAHKVRSIQPAGDIVREMMRDASGCLRSWIARFSSDDESR